MKENVKNSKVNTKIALPVRKAAILLFWLLVWQLGALAVDNPILLSSPAETFGELLVLLGKADFYLAVGKTLLRIGIGFGWGFLTGVFLAAASCRFPLLGEVMSPVLRLFKAVPVASFVVLLLIWWGSSALAVAVCFLVVLPGIYLNTLEGLKHTDPKILEMARVYRLPARTRFFYIYRPSLKPFWISGMKLSLGMCWKAGVAAEVIGVPRHSIGEQLYLSKIYLNTAGVLAQTAVILLLSLLFERLVLWLAECFFAWEPRVYSGKDPDKDRDKELDRKPDKNTIWAGSPGTGKGSGVSGHGGKDICLSHVEKAYGDRQVFKDYSRVYRQGEVYLLDSPSGSGKTTLFRILCGLEATEAGEITQGIRYSVMFQEDRLLEDYSALRNVELVTGDRDSALLALERLLGPGVADQSVSTLSGGMKRRVALVRAMEAASDAVLLDEPFTGLDEAARRAAKDYIRERQAGRTLLIASHISDADASGETGGSVSNDAI